MEPESTIDFKEAIKESDVLKKIFTNDEIDDLFYEGYYLRNTDYIYKRVGLLK